VPVIFAAVSLNANHGYVFVQDAKGPCTGCLYPDVGDDHRLPCPATATGTGIETLKCALYFMFLPEFAMAPLVVAYVRIGRAAYTHVVTYLSWINTSWKLHLKV